MSQSVALMAPLSPKRADKVSHSLCVWRGDLGGRRSGANGQTWLIASMHLWPSTWASMWFCRVCERWIVFVELRGCQSCYLGNLESAGREEGGCAAACASSIRPPTLIIALYATLSFIYTCLGCTNDRFLLSNHISTELPKAKVAFVTCCCSSTYYLLKLAVTGPVPSLSWLRMRHSCRNRGPMPAKRGGGRRGRGTGRRRRQTLKSSSSSSSSVCL